MKRKFNALERIVVLFAILSFLTIPMFSSAQEKIDKILGDWKGIIDANGRQITLIFHITKSKDGTLSGMADSPDQNSFDIPIAKVTFRADTLKIYIEDAALHYKGKMSKDGLTIEGNLEQRGSITPLSINKETPKKKKPGKESEGAGSLITVVMAGKLIDPENGTTESNVIILVKGSRITKVGRGIEIPADAKIIDLSHMAVLPGLFDCHTHVCANIRVKGDRLNSAFAYFINNTTLDRAIEGVALAKSILNAGFTTIRDVGNAGNYADVALRKAINRGIVPGPNMIITGKILAPFAGQFPVTYENPYFAEIDYIYADTRDEIKKAIRENIHYGANWIKLIVDDQRYIYSVEDLKYIINEAANAGVKVCAHCVTRRGAEYAVEAGIPSIEHGFAMNNDLLKKAKEKDIWLVGTDFSWEVLKAKGSSIRRYRRIVDRLKRAHQIGVKMAFGSDLMDDIPGYSRGEAALTLIDTWIDAGVPAADILRAFTTNAAQLLGIEKRRGTLKKGMIADIIATPENPLENIHTLKEVKFVMKSGKVYKKLVE